MKDKNKTTPCKYCEGLGVCIDMPCSICKGLGYITIKV